MNELQFYIYIDIYYLCKKNPRACRVIFGVSLLLALGDKVRDKLKLPRNIYTFLHRLSTILSLFEAEQTTCAHHSTIELRRRHGACLPRVLHSHYRPAS